jgi:hypothetical protein
MNVSVAVKLYLSIVLVKEYLLCTSDLYTGYVWSIHGVSRAKV